MPDTNMTVQDIISTLPPEVQVFVQKNLPFFADKAVKELIAWLVLAATSRKQAFKALVSQMTVAQLHAEMQRVCAEYTAENIENAAEMAAEKAMVSEAAKIIGAILLSLIAL
jgi:hypothetical protein